MQIVSVPPPAGSAELLFAQGCFTLAQGGLLLPAFLSGRVGSHLLLFQSIALGSLQAPVFSQVQFLCYIGVPPNWDLSCSLAMWPDLPSYIRIENQDKLLDETPANRMQYLLSGCSELKKHISILALVFLSVK